MSKAMMKALFPILAASAMIGDSPYSTVHRREPSEPFVSRGAPVPREKSEKELERRKEHRSKLKARRNAKKGIYTNKFKYKKRRS